MTHIQINHPQRSYLGAIADHFIRGCSAAVTELRMRRASRKSLGGLSSRYLRDIGLIESDIDAANSALLSQDVTTALKRKALVRSANW